MKVIVTLALPLTVALVLSGCDRSEEPADETTGPATGVVEESKSDVEKALEEAGQKGREAVVDTAESLRQTGDEIADTARAQGSELAEATTEKADQLIASVKRYIEENNIDLARESMDQLRAIKSSVSESVQATIDQLEQMLSRAESSPQSSQGQ